MIELSFNINEQNDIFSQIVSLGNCNGLQTEKERLQKLVKLKLPYATSENEEKLKVCATDVCKRKWIKGSHPHRS